MFVSTHSARAATVPSLFCREDGSAAERKLHFSNAKALSSERLWGGVAKVAFREGAGGRFREFFFFFFPVSSLLK